LRPLTRILEQEILMTVRHKDSGTSLASRAVLGCVLSLTLQFAAPADAQAVNRCVVDGKVLYQDAPCQEQRETVGQGIEQAKHNELLHRKLDRLQAQGYGMVQRQPHAPPPRAPESDKFVPQPRSYAAREAEEDRISAEIQEQTERKNAESAAALTRILDENKQACGGKLLDYPEIGMSDETFRNCTIHARFGGVTQIVVSEDGNVPLRLYVFPTQQARRVYSIGGVITAIKP
jgi:hypothetical protein